MYRRKFIRMEQKPQNLSLQERTKNELISKMFPKIKVDEDGKIKIDDDNKRCQELEEYIVSITPGPSSSNSSSKTLSPPDQNEGNTKSINENLPKPQESNPRETSNTIFTQAFAFVDSCSHPGQDGNKKKQDQQGPEHKKEVNFKSIPAIVVDDLQRTSEFQQLLEAIKSRDVSKLEAALNDHRSVLHISTPDHRLVELSVKEALLSFNIRILDLVYEHWATAALTSPSDRIDQLRRLTKTMIAAKDSCLDVLKVKKKVLLAQQCLVAYNNFRIILHQQLIACQESVTISNYLADKMKAEANQQRQNIITALKIYKEYTEKIIELTSFEIIDEKVYKFLADSKTEYRKFLIYNIFELYYRKLDLCIARIIIEYKRMFFVSGGPYTEVVRAVDYLLYRADEDIHLYTPNKKFKLKHLISNNDVLHSDEHLIDPNRLVIYLERVEFKNTVERFDPLRDNEKNSFLHTRTVEDDIGAVHFLKIIVTYLEQCLRSIQRLPIKDCSLIIVHVLKTLKNIPLGEKLIYAHIPLSVFNQLEKLKSYGIQQFRLKELEETRSDLCLEVIKEIDQILKVLADIIRIRKPFIDQHLLNDHFLVSDKISELQHKNSRLKMFVKQLFYLDRDELLSILKYQNTHFNKLMSKYGLTLELFSEIVMLVYNTKLLKQDLNNKQIICMKYTINNLQKYTNCVESVLKDIEERIDNGKGQFFQHESITRGWLEICYFLSVIITEFNWPGKLAVYLEDKKEISDARNFLKSLELEVKNRAEIYELNKSSHSDKQNACEYRAIEEFIDILMKKVFITNIEMEYLKENIEIHTQESQQSTLLPVFKKVLRGEEISSEDRDMILTNIEMNDRCKTIIDNLWEDDSREDFLLEYLVVRVAALKNVIGGQNLAQLVQRYKIDEGFSLLVDQLFQDIDVALKNPKSYDHRCRLDGKRYETFDFNCARPHTEVRYVDSDTLLVENLRSALELSEDLLILKQLCKLQESGLDREEIKRSWRGPKSDRLKDYFELLPEKGSVKLTKKSENCDKVHSEVLLLDSSKSNDVVVIPSTQTIDSSKLLKSLEIVVAPPETSTSSDSSVAFISTVSLSAKMSSVSAAAQAAASAAVSASAAAQAATTAAQAASTAAQAAAEASIALALLISSADETRADGQKTSD